MSQNPFSQTDLDRIAEAVRIAESKTSGEIVPYFVYQSDDYGVARWRGGTAFAAICVLIALGIEMMSGSWLPLGLLEFTGLVIISYSVGFFVLHAVPSFKRLMLSSAKMDHYVHQRASIAFLSEEIFRTRERTGILIFLSFFERKVVVMGDSGINAKVAESEWQEVVQTIVRNVKRGKPADGLIDAIRQCGELLERHGVQRRRDDTDELSDSLRIG